MMKNVLTVVTLAAASLYPAGPSWARDLVDLIPSLYGGDGITLAPAPPPRSHAPHFTLGSGEVINQLNRQIAAEVRPFPVTPSAGGITYRFDPNQGTYTQTTDTLGPVITERPETLGKGRFSIGFAFSYFEYDEFEGDDLDNLRARAIHDANTLPPEDQVQCAEFPSGRECFELDVVNINFDVQLEFKTWALSAIFGLTDRLDVGMLIPIVQSKLRVDAEARVVPAPENSPPQDPGPGEHSFVGGPESPSDSANGSDTGVGDILLGAKYFWIDQDRYGVATALRVKLATGDEDNFQGTGSSTAQPLLIAGYKLTEAINLRTNLGFEFDLKDSDRSVFLYALGVDAGNQTITGVADLLGRHELDGDGIGENIIDASFGFKWRPLERVIFSANFIIPLNDEGLRSDLISTIGLEYRN